MKPSDMTQKFLEGIALNCDFKKIPVTEELSHQNKFKLFEQEVLPFIKNIEGDFVTNGVVGAFLQDFQPFETQPYYSPGIAPSPSALPHPIGKIFDKTIYIDPYMRFNDNRIFSIPTVSRIRNDKVNDILGESQKSFISKGLDLSDYKALI